MSFTLKILASKIFLVYIKLITASLLPDRRISSNDYNLLIVHCFLTIISDSLLALAIMIDLRAALLGQIAYEPYDGKQKYLQNDCELYGLMLILVIWVYQLLFNGIAPFGISSRTCNSRGVPEVLFITVWQIQGLLMMNYSTSFSI